MTKKHLFSRLRIICVNPVILSNFSLCLGVSVAKNLFNLCNPRLINDLRAYKAPFCAFLWLKNPFNQRNLRLMNDLHAFGIFTLVESALQINLFMQNEPNFRKSQMNVNTVLTRVYEKRTLGQLGKTNPNEPKFKKAKMNVNKVLTKDYENISNWAICENEPKRTQNKPNFTSAQRPAIAVRPPALKERSDNKVHFVACWKC